MLISPAIPSITSNPADTSIVLIRTGVDAYKERSMKNEKWKDSKDCKYTRHA